MGTQIVITVDDAYLEQVDTFTTEEEKIAYIAEVISPESVAKSLLLNRNRDKDLHSAITIVGLPEKLAKKSYNELWAWTMLNANRD